MQARILLSKQQMIVKGTWILMICLINSHSQYLTSIFHLTIPLLISSYYGILMLTKISDKIKNSLIKSTHFKAFSHIILALKACKKIRIRIISAAIKVRRRIFFSKDSVEKRSIHFITNFVYTAFLILICLSVHVSVCLSFSPLFLSFSHSLYLSPFL